MGIKAASKKSEQQTKPREDTARAAPSIPAASELGTGWAPPGVGASRAKWSEHADGHPSLSDLAGTIG